MEDYILIMTELLLQYYEPTPGGDDIQMQTADVLTWFRGIIPIHPVTEHDVFEILKNTGFMQSQKILTEDEKEIGRVLVWNLYEKQ